MDRRTIIFLKYSYRDGQRVKLISMNDVNPIDEGTEGTVRFVDDIGQIHVEWDNGRRLALIPGKDKWRRILSEEEARLRAASWGLEFEYRICREEGQSIEEAFKDWDIPLHENGPEFPPTLLSEKQYRRLKYRLNHM